MNKIALIQREDIFPINIPPIQGVDTYYFEKDYDQKEFYSIIKDLQPFYDKIYKLSLVQK